MITYLQGDILNTPAITIVNTVNTVGVMGKGIALSLKNRYSGMYEDYLEACKSKRFHVGQLMYYKAVDHEILLFPTKAHWRYPSRIKWIEDGLKEFCDKYKSFGIDSIAFPMLGCGNGGLDWHDVRPVMEQYLHSLPLRIFIYTGSGPASVWRDNPIKNYQEWLHSIALDFSGIALLQRFGTHLMIPYTFIYHGQEAHMEYIPGTIKITSDTKSLILNDDEFINLWNEGLAKGYVEEDVSELKILYAMLKNMGYLEPVYIEKESGVTAGYQLLLMRDRANKLI